MGTSHSSVKLVSIMIIQTILKAIELTGEARDCTTDKEFL